MTFPSGRAEFPDRRMRRLRRTPAIRALVSETRLTVDDLVAPLFVAQGIEVPAAVESMPGVVQLPPGSVAGEVKRLMSMGIRAVILFGIPQVKDARGTGASDPDGVIQCALRDCRDSVGDGIVLICDLCLDEYTDHGHCGLVRSDGTIDNDATTYAYGEIATAQAKAGADIVAPSGMMDGQVRAIRSALDDAGFSETAIMGYAAKFASALYGPFRDAAHVTIAGGGDRRAYQQDPANGREAVEEALLDVGEGADIVMVKPAMAYLDVISAVRRAVGVPVAAYHVSGEYAMVKAAAERGWIDGDAVAMEHMLSVKRAGADVILTYFAADLARMLGA